jgi:hypothetical protein
MTGLEQPGDIQELAAITPAKRPSERTIPPLIRWRFARPKQEEQRAPREERLSVPPAERSRKERRKYCRRISDGPILLDTRSRRDRRRDKRRSADLTTSIAVEA